MQFPDEPSYTDPGTENNGNASTEQQLLYPYFGLLPYAIVVVRDAHYRIDFINSAGSNLLGKNWIEIKDQPLFELFPNWRHTLLPNAFEQVQQTGEPLSYQSTPLPMPGTADTPERFFDLTISLLQEASPPLPGLVIFAHEVTRLVQLQQRCEAKSHQMEQMTDAMPQLVWMAEADGKVVFFNRRIDEYMGVEQQADGSWVWVNMVHPEDLPATLQAWTEAMSNGNAFQSEHRARKNDGQYRWHLNRAFPYRGADGRVLKWFGTLTDIDDQKKAAEEIRERDLQLLMSQTQLGMALSAAQIGTWQGNAKTGQLVWSKELEAMHGLAEGSFGGTIPEWTAMVHPDDREFVAQQAAPLFQSIDDVELEYRIVQPSGKIRWIFSKIRGYRDAAGNPETIFGISVDVTSQRSHQQQVAEAELRWRIAIEANNMGTWEWNTLTNEVELSASTRALLELDPDEPWFFEKTRGLTHEDDVEQALAQVRPVLEGQKDTFTYEARHRRVKSGQLRWVRMAGKAVHNGSGRPTRIIGTIKDITRFKENQQALLYQKQLLETVTGNTSFALFLMNEQHQCIYINEQAEKMTGYRLEDLQGRSLHNVVNPTYADGRPYPIEESPIDQALVQGRRTRGEEMFRHKAGHFYPVAFTASPIMVGGKPMGTVIEVRDITEEKKVALGLQLSEERFRLLTNTIPQITWISRNDGLIDYISDQWTQYTGQQKEDAREGYIHCVHPDDRQEMMDKWAASKANKEPLEIEYRLRASDGSYRWFGSKTQPLLNQEGEVISWIGAANEIQHFKDVSALLEEQVATRTQELRRVNKTLQQQASELQRSNEDLQQFAHVASHDLKEPVRKIKTFASRLQDELGTDMPPRAQHFLTKIDEATERIYSMIDGVLEYSQLDAAELKPTPVPLAQVLDQIIADLELTIQEKEAQIHVEPMPVIKGQPILLYQLFYNLLNNSLKFAQPGQKPQIRVHASDAGAGMAAISVSDNGIGFNQEHAEKIFKTFTRLNAREKFEGTGLGLALCRKIAARHGGSIHAAGKAGEGATFTVTLPVEESRKPDDGSPKNDV
ncbi:PAS domain-containing protein [Pseudocnuella soli]|uniref:PAS domain-containing protein n=1 Tax=Pseudocnuella soli TaxID=2502779 RepID=UPI001043C296|nr:PAS domain-containing protein [Pseudocnuella soli]